MEHLRLRNLGILAKLGLTCLLLVLAGGMAASLQHMAWHHENRDERRGLTLTDIQGVYHGVRTPALLADAIERGHPEGLAEPYRDALINWLRGKVGDDGKRTPPDAAAVWRDYDNFDLGEFAPSEIIAANCLSCHSRAEAPTKGAGIPLEYREEVERVAITRQVNPMDIKVLAMSTHAHALSLGTMSIVLAGMLVLTSWPRAIPGSLVAATGAALLVDLAGWWIARQRAWFVPVLAGAGAVYSIGTVLGLLAVAIDLWKPRLPSHVRSNP